MRMSDVVEHKGPLVTLTLVAVVLAGFLVANATSAAPTSAEDETSESSAGASDDPESDAADPPPDDSPFPDEVLYAGRTDSGAATLAIAVKGTKAVAYLCDGRNVESWLTGTVDGDSIELEAEDGSGSIQAVLTGDRLAGSARAGARFGFDIGVAGPPAGLYRGADGETTLGWIILPDGTQIGVQNTGGTTSAAPELDPEVGSVVVGDVEIAAETVTSEGW